MQKYDLSFSFASNVICEEQILALHFVSVRFADRLDHSLVLWRQHKGLDDVFVHSSRLQASHFYHI